MSIKNDQYWKTFVVVSNNSDTWFDMCINPHELYLRLKDYIENPSNEVHIELWKYHRKETGDDLISKEKLCHCCWSYGVKGKIYNANQWVNCPACNNN